ncbi:MAG: hypothetical protein ACFB9N_03090 [Geitlerinemataceae cyanobacterium]
MTDSRSGSSLASPSGSPRLGDRRWNFLALAFVALGALQRLVQYASNRSLWGDEAALALNLRDRGWSELLWQTLDFNQAAPPGFLAIEKGAIALLGNSEYSLRLFPLMAGLASLVGMYVLARRLNRPLAGAIAVGLFACLRYTSYYATEVKQYSSDVAIALVFFLWLTELRSPKLERSEATWLALLGGLAVWFCHPVIFVMAGVELWHWIRVAWGAANPFRTIAGWIRSRFAVYFAWVASFGAMYVLTIRSTLENEALTDSWGDRYPDDWLDIGWFFDAIGRFFYRPLGFLGWTDGVAIAAFLVGAIALGRGGRRGTLALLLAPVAMTLLASYLHAYPFRERLVLFLAPFALAIVAEGVAVTLVGIFRGAVWRRIVCAAFGLLFAGALVGWPVVKTVGRIAEPRQIEEIRPVLAQVRAGWEVGDRLYVYPPGRNQFLYYAPMFEFVPEDYAIGVAYLAPQGGNDLESDDICAFVRELAEFTSDDRVWLLFSRASDREQQTLLDLLDPEGLKLDSAIEEGAFAYLFDLRGWQIPDRCAP